MLKGVSMLALAEMEGNFLLNFGTWITHIFYGAFTLVAKLFGLFADLLNMAFYVFAGIDFTGKNDNGAYNITLNSTGESVNILDYFVLSETMMKSYLALALIGLLLIVVFTIYKIVKQDYFDKSGPRSKGPIFRNVAISCISFLLVIPIFLIIIHASSLLAVVVTDALGTDATQLAGAKIFCLSWSDDGESVKYISGLLNGGDGTAPFTTMWSLHPETLFTMMAKGKHVAKFPEITNSLGIGTWNGPLTEGGILLDDGATVNGTFFWYIYFIGAYTAVKALWKLVLVMIQRIFKLMALFLVAPAAISRYVLDDGQTYKTWLATAVQNGLKVVVSSMAFSIYLMVITLIKDIDFLNAFGVVFERSTSGPTSASLLAYNDNGLLALPMLEDASFVDKAKDAALSGLDTLVNAFMKIVLVSAAGAVIFDLDIILTTMITPKDGLEKGSIADSGAVGAGIAAGGTFAAAGINKAAKIAGTVMGGVAGVAKKAAARVSAASQERRDAARDGADAASNNNSGGGTGGTTNPQANQQVANSTEGATNNQNNNGNNNNQEENEQTANPQGNQQVANSTEGATNNQNGNENGSDDSEEANTPENLGLDNGPRTLTSYMAATLDSAKQAGTTILANASERFDRFKYSTAGKILGAGVGLVKGTAKLGFGAAKGTAKLAKNLVGGTAQSLLGAVGLGGLANTASEFNNARKNAMPNEEQLNKVKTKEYSKLRQERNYRANKVAEEREQTAEQALTNLNSAINNEDTAGNNLNQALAEQDVAVQDAASENAKVDKMITANRTKIGKVKGRGAEQTAERNTYKQNIKELESFSFKDSNNALTQEMKNLGIGNMRFEDARARVMARGSGASDELRAMFNNSSKSVDQIKASWDGTRVARQANIHVDQTQSNVTACENAFSAAVNNRQRVEESTTQTFASYASSVAYADKMAESITGADGNGRYSNVTKAKVRGQNGERHQHVDDLREGTTRANRRRQGLHRETRSDYWTTESKQNEARALVQQGQDGLDLITRNQGNEEYTIRTGSNGQTKRVLGSEIINNPTKYVNSENERVSRLARNAISAQSQIEMGNRRMGLANRGERALQANQTIMEHNEQRMNRQLDLAQRHEQNAQVFGRYASMSDQQLTNLNDTQRREINSAMGRGRQLDVSSGNASEIRSQLQREQTRATTNSERCLNRALDIEQQNRSTNQATQAMLAALTRGLGESLAHMNLNINANANSNAGVNTNSLGQRDNATQVNINAPTNGNNNADPLREANRREDRAIDRSRDRAIESHQSQRLEQIYAALSRVEHQNREVREALARLLHEEQ